MTENFTRIEVAIRSAVALIAVDAVIYDIVIAHGKESPLLEEYEIKRSNAEMTLEWEAYNTPLDSKVLFESRSVYAIDMPNGERYHLSHDGDYYQFNKVLV